MKSSTPTESERARWRDLIGRHLLGEISAPESRELESALSTHREIRDAFRRQCHLDAALREEAETIDRESTEWEENTSSDRSSKKNRWLSWSPITAAAIGIVLGMCGASMVFGRVLPRAVTTSSRLFSLEDGGFETRTGRLPPGFPVAFGVWTGDEAEVVSAPNAQAENAKEGTHALRFVRAEREPSLPNYGAASCDVYQLVDLRPLRSGLTPQEATLELSVQFRDARESAGECVVFIGRLHVFSGSPEALPAEWPLTQKDSLATACSQVESIGGVPQAWHALSTRVLLPPQADFAVVHLVAHKPKTLRGEEAQFGAQFADDVRLTLKTHPVLPVRLAQR